MIEEDNLVKNRLFKKVMAAIVAAAMLFTSNGITTMNASAAKKVAVEYVYTNFNKATMVTGTTKQITTYTEPENATNKDMKYFSSNSKVASVSRSGLVTAMSPGTATISVIAMDGSEAEEKITITVLKDRTITKKSLDSDKEVIVLDKTYGNVTIKSNVGKADIYLSNVKINGTLTLESGSDYSLYLYDSVVNEIVIDEANGDGIVSLSENKTKAPKINITGTTGVKTLTGKASFVMKQQEDSTIEYVTLLQDKANQINSLLEGFKGNLFVEGSEKGEVVLEMDDCQIPVVKITGKKASGLIKLLNRAKSMIENATFTGEGNYLLSVPADKVEVDGKALGMSLELNEVVGTLNNNGSDVKFAIGGAIENFNSAGKGAKIIVNRDGSVVLLELTGADTLVSGSGTISEAYVNANNCAVNTANTLVMVGKVRGTLVQGVATEGGQSKTTVAPIVVGGGPAAPEKPKPVYKAGDIIVDNDYEDNKNALISVQGNVSMSIVSGGKDSSKALKIDQKTASWNGAGYGFDQYLNQNITIRVKVDMKPVASGDIKTTLKSNAGYSQIAEIKDAEAGQWYTLEGTFLLDKAVTSAVIYFEAPGDTTGYMLDNLKITVDSIGQPVPITEVIVAPTTLSLDIGQSSTLKATIMPENFTTDGTIAWVSSDPSIATVDASGKVTGIKAGTVEIKAMTMASGVSTTVKDAKCDVTVNDTVALEVNPKVVILTSQNETATLSANLTESLTWSSSDTKVATVADGVVTAVGNGTAIITAQVTGTERTATCKVIVDTNAVFANTYDTNTNIGFTSRGSGTPVYENGYIKVTGRTSNWHGAIYALDHLKGRRVKFTADVKHQETLPTQVKVTYTYNNGSSQYKEIASSGSIEGGEWKTITGEFEIENTHSSPAIYFESPSSTANIYFDNVIISVVNAPAPGQGGTILSQDFEDGKSYGLTGTIDTGITFENEGYQSNKSIKVIPSSAGWGNPGYNLLAYKGKTVTIIAYMKHEDTGEKQLKATVQLKSDGNPDEYKGEAQLLPAGEWKRFEQELAIPSNVTSARLYFEKAETNVANFYVDNVLIYEGPKSQALVEYEKLFPSQHVPITGVTLNKSSMTLNIGEEASLIAAIQPNNATTSKTLTWSSSDTTVATVDATGKVKAISAGNATIKVSTTVNGVSANAYEAECVVTVNEEVALQINRKHVIMSAIGNTITLTSNKENMEWSSSNDSVASVDSNGVVTANADGLATITAKVVGTDEIKKCDIVVNSRTVANSSFEDGDSNVVVSGTGAISDSSAYDGSKSLLVEATQDYHGPEYIVDNTSGTGKRIIKVSAYVKSYDAVNVPLRYSTTSTKEGNTNYSEVATTTSSGEWTLFEGTVTVDAGVKTTVRLAPQNAKTGNYYVDCWHITEEIVPQITPIDIVADFEASNPFDNYISLGQFGNTGGGIRSVSGSSVEPVGYQSDRCLQLEATADWHGVAYYINNTDALSVTYTVSAQVKLVEGTTAKVRFQTQKHDEGGAPYLQQEFDINESNWTNISVSITLQQGASVRMELKPTNNERIVYLVDDFRVTNQ